MNKYLIICCLILLSACEVDETFVKPNIEVNVEAESIRFAAFGDFGVDGLNQAKVAGLVNYYEPDFIITMGDNNYPSGAAETIVQNIGKYYCEYIYNFDAPSHYRCNGQAEADKQNRFFPTLGNHDYYSTNEAYMDYFTLPGNEQYYDFVWGPVHFYALDSSTDFEIQKEWFEEKISQSESEFDVVYFHHSPYSSGLHHYYQAMRWDFSQTDLVLTGHDHIYERSFFTNNPKPMYIINGLGGKSKRTCNVLPLDTNQFTTFCYDEDYGSLFIEANAEEMDIQFVNVNGELIDRVVITP